MKKPSKKAKPDYGGYVGAALKRLDDEARAKRKKAKARRAVKAVKAYALIGPDNEIDFRTQFSVPRRRLKLVLDNLRSNGWSNGDHIIPVLITPLTNRSGK